MPFDSQESDSVLMALGPDIDPLGIRIRSRASKPPTATPHTSSLSSGRASNPDPRHTMNWVGRSLSARGAVSCRAVGKLRLERSRRASYGRFWHGSAVRFGQYGRPAICALGGFEAQVSYGGLNKSGGAFLVFRGQGMQRKCPTSRQNVLSACFRRMTLRESADCRGARSTGRLRGASCGRHGCATGSASSPPSWSAGSASGRPRRFASWRRQAGGRFSPRRTEACARSSARRRKLRGRSR